MEEDANNAFDLWMQRVANQAGGDDAAGLGVAIAAQQQQQHHQQQQQPAQDASDSDSDDDDDNPLAALRREGRRRQQQQAAAAAQQNQQHQQHQAALNLFTTDNQQQQQQQEDNNSVPLEDELHLASRSHNILSPPDREQRLSKWKELLLEVERRQQEQQEEGGQQNSSKSAHKPAGRGTIDDIYDTGSVAAYAQIFTQAWTLESDSLLLRRARAHLTSEMIFLLEVERDEGRRRVASSSAAAAAAAADGNNNNAAAAASDSNANTLQQQYLKDFERQHFTSTLPPPRSLHFTPCSIAAQQCLDAIQRDRCFTSPDRWLRLLAEIATLPLSKVRHVWQYAIKTFPSATWLVCEYVELEIQAEQQLWDTYRRNKQQQQHHHHQSGAGGGGGAAAVTERLALMTARLRILDTFEAHLPVCVGSAMLHARFLRYATETVGGLDAVTELKLCKLGIEASGRCFDAYALWREVLKRRQGLLDDASVRVTRALFHELLKTPIDDLDQARAEYLQFEKKVQRRDTISQTLSPPALATAHRLALDEFSERRNVWEIIAQRQRWPGGVAAATKSLGGSSVASAMVADDVRRRLNRVMGAGPGTTTTSAAATGASGSIGSSLQAAGLHPLSSTSPWCAPSTTDAVGQTEFNFTAMQTLPVVLPPRPSSLLRIEGNDNFFSVGDKNNNSNNNESKLPSADDAASLLDSEAPRARSDAAIAGSAILGYHAAWDAIIELESGAVSFTSNSSGSGSTGGGDHNQAQITTRSRRVCKLWEQRCRSDPHIAPSHWIMWARARQSVSVNASKMQHDTLSVEERLREAEAVLQILFEGVNRFPESVVLSNCLADALTSYGDVASGNATMFSLTQYGVMQAKTMILLEQEVATMPKSIIMLPTQQQQQKQEGNFRQLLQQHSQVSTRRVAAMMQLLRARNCQTFCSAAASSSSSSSSSSATTSSSSDNNSSSSSAGGFRVQQFVVPLLWRFCDRPRINEWLLSSPELNSGSSSASSNSGSLTSATVSLYDPAFLNSGLVSLVQDPRRQQQKLQLRGLVKDQIAFGCVAWMRWVLRAKSSRFWEATLGNSTTAAGSVGVGGDMQQQQQQDSGSSSSSSTVDTSRLHLRAVAKYSVADCGLGRHTLFLHGWAQLEATCGSQESAAAAVANIVCGGWEANIRGAIAAAGRKLKAGLLEQIETASTTLASPPLLLGSISRAVAAAAIGSNTNSNNNNNNNSRFLQDCGADSLFFDSLRTLDLLRSACGVPAMAQAGGNNNNTNNNNTAILEENACRSRLASLLFEHMIQPCVSFLKKQAAADRNEKDQHALSALTQALEDFALHKGNTNQEDLLQFLSLGGRSGQQQQHQPLQDSTTVSINVLSRFSPALFALAAECHACIVHARTALQVRSGLVRGNKLSERVAAAIHAAQLATGSRSTTLLSDVSASMHSPSTLADAFEDADDDECCLQKSAAAPTASSSSLRNQRHFQQHGGVLSDYNINNIPWSAVVRPELSANFRRVDEAGNELNSSSSSGVGSKSILGSDRGGGAVTESERLRLLHEQKLQEYQRQMGGATVVGGSSNNNMMNSSTQAAVARVFAAHARIGGSSSTKPAAQQQRRGTTDLYDAVILNQHNNTPVWSWDAAAAAMLSKAAAPVPQSGVSAANVTQQQTELQKLVKAATAPAATKAVDSTVQFPLTLITNAASLSAKISDADTDALTADLALGNVDDGGGGVTTTGQEEEDDDGGYELSSLSSSSSVTGGGAAAAQAQWDLFGQRFSSSALVRVLHALPSRHGLALRPEDERNEGLRKQVKRQQQQKDGAATSSNAGAQDGAEPEDLTQQLRRRQREEEKQQQQQQGNTGTSLSTTEVLYPRTDFVMRLLRKI